jgi:predicted RNase H-like HicB family nuclease
MMMTYQVFLEQTPDSSYRAIPLVFPDCVAVGETRDEALANLKAALSARLAEGELVTVEVGESEHSWLRGAGIFKDDDTYDDLLCEIEVYRRELDEAERNRGDVSARSRLRRSR